MEVECVVLWSMIYWVSHFFFLDGDCVFGYDFFCAHAAYHCLTLIGACSVIFFVLFCLLPNPTSIFRFEHGLLSGRSLTFLD